MAVVKAVVRGLVLVERQVDAKGSASIALLQDISLE